jgi:DNA-binding SARP family transcriptional activator
MGDLALFRERRDEEPLLRSGKSLALLAYLALAPRGEATRQHLAELLWPDLGRRAQQHCLRQCLYRLRHVTAGSPVILSHRQDVQVGPGVRFDFHEGEAALAAGDYEAAERLLRGDFLEGFSVPEAREFERWVESKRTGFHSSWVRAARTLVEERLADHDLAGAIEMAEALVARRPFDDKAMRLLLVSLAGRGRYALATARYQTYVRLLESEMGEKPPKDLERYAQELRGCAVSASLRPLRDTRFVGRTDEWFVLEETWNRAPDWDGALLLLQGASGSGKTRLLLEFSDRARAGGAVVLDATRPEPGSRFPNTPEVVSLRSVARLPGLARLERNILLGLIRLLPRSPEPLTDLTELDPGGGSSDSGALRQRALAGCLKDLAARGGLLITIDHLQWADAPSLRLLHFLTRQLRDVRALLLAAFRPEELSAEGRRFVDVTVSEGLGRLVRIGEVEPPVGHDHSSRRGGSEGKADDEAIAGYLDYFTSGNPTRPFELLQGLREPSPDGEGGTGQILGSDVEALRKVIAAIISARGSGPK